MTIKDLILNAIDTQLIGLVEGDELLNELESLYEINSNHNDLIERCENLMDENQELKITINDLKGL